MTASELSGELHGTWSLISSTRKVLETGEIEDTYGVAPQGYITYGSDGRMLVLIVRNDRPKPTSIEAISDQQRADLHRSMTAYGGTYTYDGKSVQHHIDVSWNEVWTGTTIIRDIERQGDLLVLTTRPAPFSGDGKMIVGTLIWEKVKTPR